MKKTKRLFSLILVFVFVVLAIIPAAFAAGSYNGFERRDGRFAVSIEEAEYMRSQLAARELCGEDFFVEPLYDSNGEASFLLGTTELGFAIINRNDRIVYECGEANPFAEYEECKKYYTGAMSYYIRKAYDNEFRNLITQIDEELPSVRLIESVFERGIEFDEPSASLFKLRNSHYITQYAFGYNSDGTCSAVAAAIALNYLKKQFGLPVTINSTMTPELFTKNGKTFPSTYNLVNLLHPKAEKLHQKLNQYGVYGWAINAPLNNFFEDWISDSTKRPLAIYDSNYNSVEKIKQYIGQNRPMIVCTYQHSMAAYGCRSIFGNGSRTDEVLVHNGWHNANMFRVVGNKYEHVEHYVNINALRALYSFILPAGY